MCYILLEKKNQPNNEKMAGAGQIEQEWKKGTIIFQYSN